MSSSDDQLDDELRARWRWVAIGFIVLAAVAVAIAVVVLWDKLPLWLDPEPTSGPR